jgi:hypothetical protein
VLWFSQANKISRLRRLKFFVLQEDFDSDWDDLCQHTFVDHWLLFIKHQMTNESSNSKCKIIHFVGMSIHPFSFMHGSRSLRMRSDFVLIFTLLNNEMISHIIMKINSESDVDGSIELCKRWALPLQTGQDFW